MKMHVLRISTLATKTNRWGTPDLGHLHFEDEAAGGRFSLMSDFRSRASGSGILRPVVESVNARAFLGTIPLELAVG
jgi:hypothetical protein